MDSIIIRWSNICLCLRLLRGRISQFELKKFKNYIKINYPARVPSFYCLQPEKIDQQKKSNKIHTTWNMNRAWLPIIELIYILFSVFYFSSFFLNEIEHKNRKVSYTKNKIYKKKVNDTRIALFPVLFYFFFMSCIIEKVFFLSMILCSLFY